VPKDARAYALHDAVNYAPFARCVSALKHNYDFGASGFHPFLHLDQIGLQFAQFPLILFSLQRNFSLVVAILLFFVFAGHSASGANGGSYKSTAMLVVCKVATVGGTGSSISYWNRDVTRISASCTLADCLSVLTVSVSGALLLASFST
jgi:hypothetical protein